MEPDWNGTITNLEFKSLTEYLTREVFKRLMRWKWHKVPTMTKTMIISMARNHRVQVGVAT